MSTPRIHRWLKWASASLLALLAMALLAPLLFALFIDQDDYKRWLSDAVEARTGRPLLIEGDLTLRFSPKPSLRVAAIRYPNAAWGQRPWAIEVEQAAFTLNPRALLRGKLAVDEIVLEKPTLWVERNAAGEDNFATPAGLRQPSQTTGLPAWLDIASVDIRDGEIAVATPRREWNIHIQAARARRHGRGQPVAIEFRGEVEQVPLIATASVGSLETLFAQQPSALAINGHLGAPLSARENRFNAVGSARNLLKWHGIDLQLDFAAARLPALSALTNTPLPQRHPIVGVARFHQPAYFNSMQLQAIQLKSTEFGLRNTVTGQITQLARLDGMDLQLTASGTLALPTPALALTGPLDATLNAVVRGSSRDLKIQVDGSAQNAAVSLHVGGAIGWLSGGWRGALPVSLVINNLAELNGMAGRRLARIGAVTAAAELTRETSGLASGESTSPQSPQFTWHLRNLKLSLAREALKITVEGSISRLAVGPHGRLSINLAAADGRYLQAWFEQPLPPISNARLVASVAFGGEGGAVTVDLDKLAARVHGVDLTASGAIGDLTNWRDVDLAIGATAGSLQALSALAGRALPPSGPVRARARLADDPGGQFNLMDISAAVTAAAVSADATPTELKARGAIHDLGGSMRAAIDLDLTLASTEPLRTWLATALSPVAARRIEAILAMVTPLKASARLSSSPPLVSAASGNSASWQLQNLNATSLATGIEAVLSGEVAAFAPLDGRFHLALKDFQMNHAAFSQLPGAWAIPMPAGGRLNLSLDLLAGQGQFAAENLTATIDSAAATVALRGAIEGFQPLEIQTITVEFEANSGADLGWFGADLFNPDSPVSGSAAVLIGAHRTSGAADNHADLRLEIGSSDARGRLEWRLPDEKQAIPWFYAKLASKRLDLVEILARSAKKVRFFPATPLHVDWLRQINGRVELTAAEFSSRQIDLDEAVLRVGLHQGALMQTVRGRMGSGDLSMTLTLDANAQPPASVFRLTGKGLDSAGLVAFREDKYIDSGTFDVMIDFTGAGVSMADLAANGRGGATFRLDNAKMKNQALDAIGGDIFSKAMSVINPFRARGEYVDIECGRMRLAFADGKATIGKNDLAMRTDKVTLFGGGEIDLSDESLNILILPKARRGFGINASSIVKIIRLGGTLAQPTIETDASPKKLLQTGAALWAGIASGGLSLIIKGVYDRFHANTDICAPDTAETDNRTKPEQPDDNASPKHENNTTR